MKWGRLTDLIENGKGLDINKALFFVFSDRDIQLFTIELNTQGQLFLLGIDSKGTELSSIGGNYSPITKDIKVSEGLPIDRVTLYQDGDFYKSFDFVQTNEGFYLTANTIKEGDDLRDRWGSDILGLTQESINELAQEILPEVIKSILRQLLQ